MKFFRYRYLPLHIYLGYCFFAVCALFIGPIEYKDLDYFVLVSYIGAIGLTFTVGYIAGAGGNYPHSMDFSERLAPYQRHARFFRLILLLGVVSAAAQWYAFIFSSETLSLEEIGENYVKSYEGYERGQANVDLMYIVTIFDQALATLVLLCFFYYYRVMGHVARTAFLFVVVTYLLINVIGTGKQKYLADVVIFLFYCLAIKFAVNRKRIRLSAILGSVAGMFLVFALFVEILRQRYAAAGINLDNIYERSHPLIAWDQESVIFGLVSVDYALPLGIFLGYFTNGLYGLYLSLTLPFEWTYLLGNSYSLSRIVEIALGTDGAILEHTYPYRVGEVYGWDFEKWHSLFAWLASDITFAGILALSFVFAYFYARLWIQAIRARNAFAGPLFIYLSLGLMFSFANNQIMHSLAGVIVLLVLVSGWLFSSHAARRSCGHQYAHSDLTSGH